MGRHSAGSTSSVPGGLLGALTLALGIGVAVVGGAGVAHAESSPEQSDTRSVADEPASGAKVHDAEDDTTHPSETTSDAPASKASDDDDDDRPPSTSRTRAVNRHATEPEEHSDTTAVSDPAAETPAAETSTAALPDGPPSEEASPRFSTLANRAKHAPAEPLWVVPDLADAIAKTVTHVTSALGIPPAAISGGGAPIPPPPPLDVLLQQLAREIEFFAAGHLRPWPTMPSVTIPDNDVPAVASAVPTAADEMPTAYGDLGKWMLQANGQIANWGGLLYGGKTLLEPVNVVIVDPTSASAEESDHRLNSAMACSGFPAQLFHSTGFHGTIDDVSYGQQPTGPLLAFSDNLFILPNHHGRIFGPDPVETSTGFVWSGAFSTEQFVLCGLQPRHVYVSSNMARNALATRLIGSGRATYGGMVALDNSYNTATSTTGDHDGYAAVVVLT